MNNDTRQGSGGSSRSKRRLVENDEETRPTPAADDPTSNSKRQRVSRACDSCRSKKDKCDGVQPICSTCASLARPCTYKANPKKRGLPTGYIRTLEMLWGLVFTKIQGSEEVVRALLKSANILSHLANMGKEAEGSDTLLSTWKNSIVLKDIERLLTLLEQPDEEQQERGGRAPREIDSPADAEGSSVLSSDTLEWHLPDPMRDGRETSLALGLSPVKTPTTVSTIKQTPTRVTRDSGSQTVPQPAHAGDLSHTVISQNPSRHQINSQPPIPTESFPPRLPSNPWPLLDIYFSYTQCWFPIIEKHDILRTAFRHGEDSTHISASSVGSGDHAALWAVLTLASLQESSFSVTRQPTQFPDDRVDPTQLYSRAKSLIPEEDGGYEIGHVQALLILSLIKFGQQDWTAAWILVGQAVRIAQSLDLHNPTNIQTTTAEGKAAGRSKHVVLGCFVLETLIAAQTGQVPSLRKCDLTKIGAINEDGLEEWHPWEDQSSIRPAESSRGAYYRGPLHALSAFNRLANLVCILNDLCCWGKCLTNSMSHLEAMERQLQLWVSALPRNYRVDPQSNATRPAPPHIFGLEMMYEGASTAISIQLATQKSDRNTLDRAADSSRRLLALFQMYTETYGVSATCPTFPLILQLGVLESNPKTDAVLSSEMDPSIRNKLLSFSAHLATIWSMDSRCVPEPGLGPIVSTRPATSPQRNPYGGAGTMHNSLGNPETTPRGMNVVDETRPGNLVIPESFLSATWMRAPPSVEDNVTLSLPTPTPSLHINTIAETPRPTSHPKEPSYTHHQRPSISRRHTNGAGIISTPLGAPVPQYQPPYNDPNLQLSSLVDMDAYGSLRRPRIAPDLDALFDELASLDGTERIDNQPEFMQNLGFVPEAGFPELYPYTSQTESFMLAPSHTSLTSPETTLVRQESHPANEPILNPNR